MSKLRYYCQSCGNETPKWQGKCPACKEWNTIIEEPKINSKSKQNVGLSSLNNSPTLIQNVSNNATTYRKTTDNELNNVLGGGIVDGSIILLAGEPGVGKSTLLL